MTIQQDRHRIRNLIAVMSLALGILSGLVWFVNKPAVFNRVLSFASAASSWHFSAGEFHFRPFDGRVDLKDVHATRDSDNNGLSVDAITLEFSPFGFLRGKLVITDLSVENAVASVAKPDAKKRKKLNLAKLLLLRNLVVENGSVNGFAISVGDNLTAALQDAKFSVSRSLFGETEVAATINNISVTREAKKFAFANSATVDADTELSSWTQSFPYVGNLDGAVRVSGLDFQGIQSGELEVNGKYSEKELSLDKLSVSIGSGVLIGSARADLENKTFSTEVEIPNPVYLPYFGKPMITFDTAGALTAKISAEGKGFKPTESEGSAKIFVSHRFDVAKDAPVEFSSNVSWKSGVATVSDAKVNVGNSQVPVKGSISLPAKKMSFTAEGSKFPSEHVMNKFKNKHLKKIFGATDFTGSFDGWGKDFKAHFSASVENGGWQPIVAETAKVELDITYNDISLDGEIFAAGKKTGEGHLKVKYGAETPSDVPRNKNIDFTGEIHDHPVETSLGAFGIKGIGNGEVKISGPATAFKGSASGSITDGSLYSIDITKAAAKMDMTNKLLSFTDIAISAANTSSSGGSLKADIDEGKTRFYGQPMKGLSLDATYFPEDSRWDIKSASWMDESQKNSIDLAGKYVSKGQMNLALKSNTQFEILKPFLRQISGGEGSARANLTIQGMAEDPSVTGTIDVDAEDFSLRETRFMFDRVTGELKLTGKKIIFDGLKARSDDGSVDISGSLDHRGKKLSYADLKLSGENIRFRSADDELNLEFGGTLALKGDFPNPVLSGDISIIDGRYTRDFTIVDAITGGTKADVKKKKKQDVSSFDPAFNLKIRTVGDLRIKNNVGDIWLSADIGLQGKRSKPLMAGTINASEGEIHYLGVNFDVTKGFIEFREKYEEPYLEVHAQRELRTYTASLVLYGNIDNLALDLSATSASGPLEKRDVVSLILFGATEQERNANPGTQSQFASSMAARSVSGIFEGQVSKFTGLDVFRLEAADSTSSKISRMTIGKDLSDRLSFKFSTDINSDAAVQTIIAEYLLTDNLLLKGSSSTDQSYQLSGLLRFRNR